MLIAGDVKSRAFCKRAVERVVRELGRLDVLVNNAAFQKHAESLEDISDERFDETLRTNVYGYFHMARAALPHLARGASIINTGSVVGLEGSGHLLDYSTTKGAIHAFTKSLAQNLVEQRHPRQCGRARAGLDAAQSGRSARRGRSEIRAEHRHEARRAARRAVAGIRVPGFAGVLRVHHRHRASGHR